MVKAFFNWFSKSETAIGLFVALAILAAIFNDWLMMVINLNFAAMFLIIRKHEHQYRDLQMENAGHRIQIARMSGKITPMTPQEIKQTARWLDDWAKNDLDGYMAFAETTEFVRLAVAAGGDLSAAISEVIKERKTYYA
jgi:hypothetical protein